MKILHLTHLYYPSIGGNQIHMKGLSEKLVKLGEDVTVFTSNVYNVEQFNNKNNLGASNLPLKETVNGVKVRRFPINYTLNKMIFDKLPKIRGGYRLKKILFGDFIKPMLRGPGTYKMLWEIIKFSPDIAITLNSYNAHTYFCYLARKIYRFPLVLIPSFSMGSPWQDDLAIDMFLDSADLVIALTPYEKEVLMRKGIDGKKICVIGVGIDPYQFSNANGTAFKDKYKLKDEPIVTFLGRKVRGKGIETLIDAMSIVWKEAPRARLVLAGRKYSEFTAILENKISSLTNGNKEKVILIDDFSQEEKPNIFAACDIFAMPSSGECGESFGIVYLEAWVCKKPVIACKNSAPSTLIDDGQDGLLVEYGNKHEIASAILRLLNDKNMAARLGEMGRKKVLREYTWDTIASKIRNQYYRLVNKNSDNDSEIA